MTYIPEVLQHLSCVSQTRRGVQRVDVLACCERFAAATSPLLPVAPAVSWSLMATVHSDRLSRPAFTSNYSALPLAQPPAEPPQPSIFSSSVDRPVPPPRGGHTQLLQTFQAAPTASVTAIQFCPNRIHALFASASRTLHLINPSTSPSDATSAAIPSSAIRLYHPPHAYDITCIGVTASSQHLLSGSSDRQLIVTQTETAQTLRKLKAHEMRVNALAVSGDTVCATASADSTVRLWDLRAMRDHRPMQTATHSRDSVTAIAFLPSSPAFVSASMDGCLRVYDIRRGEVTVDDLTEPITAIDVGEYGDIILAATTASHLLLVDRTTKSAATVLRQFEGDSYKSERYSVQCVLVDGGKGVVSGTESGNGLLRWDVTSGRLVDSWCETRQQGVSGCVAWEQSNGLLLSGSTNGTVCVWQVPL